MTNIWSNAYKEQILKLLPPDGTLIKAGLIYKKSNLSTVTVSKYLKLMEEEDKIIERVQKSQKDVSYRRLENVRLQSLIEQFSDEFEKSIKVLAKNSSADANSLANQLAENWAESSKSNFDSFKFFLQGFKNDRELIEEALLYNLLTYMFRIIRQLTHVEIAKSEDFYIDCSGNLMPKRLVDERIKYDEVPEWKYNIAFHESTLAMIKQGLNKGINKRLKERDIRKPTGF